MNNSVKINSKLVEEAKSVFKKDKELPQDMFITNETAINYILTKSLMVE